MAGTRTVYRGSGGKFAGSGKGKAEKVKAGGFANAAFRARVAQSRAANAGNARPPGGGGQKASRGKSLGGAARARKPLTAAQRGTRNRGLLQVAVGVGATAYATRSLSRGNLGAAAIVAGVAGPRIAGHGAAGALAPRLITANSRKSYNKKNARPKNPSGSRVKR